MSQLGITTSVITTIEKCLALYRTITAARNFGSDAARSVMMLRFEAFRYQEWARDNEIITKILGEASSEDEPPPLPPTVGLVAAKQAISPVTTFREALCDAVNQVKDVLQSVNKLLVKYEGAIQSRESPGGDAGPASYGVAALVIARGQGGGEMQDANQKYIRLKESLQSKTSFARRVKYGIQTWDDADKETLKSLIQLLKYWNDNLHEIAPPKKPYLQDSWLASRVLASAVSCAQLESVQDAAESNYDSVYRSASLKKDTIAAMVVNSGLEKKYENVRIDAKVARSRRFITEYWPKGRTGSPAIAVPVPQRVIVEWYYYDAKWEDEQMSIANDRVERLAQQLSLPDKPANLPVLHCIGWIQHPTKRDRALLYEIPERCGSMSLSHQPATLHDILNSGRSLSPHSLPSLRDRFRLAAALSLGFLELHTVEWIHKGFGSHNVLLFSGADGKVCYDKPFISGFDFSRPDRVGEKSLSTRPSKFDIYRHPELRLINQSSYAMKPSSSRAHDIYSLGLVLFEIGMWLPLESYVKANLSPENFRARIQGYAQRDVVLWMGNRFSAAVCLCLSGEYLQNSEAFPLGCLEEDQFEEEQFNAPGSGDPASDQSRISAQQLSYFYRAVVAELHGCQCEMGSDKEAYWH